MYQRINRNSVGQFMRSRSRFFFVSAMPQENEVKDKDGIIHKIVTWLKGVYVKPDNVAAYNKGKRALKAA